MTSTDSTDSTDPATQLGEESQEDRGEMGSRDTGDPEPGGGATDRDSGTSDPKDYTGINPDDPSDAAGPSQA